VIFSCCEEELTMPSTTELPLIPLDVLLGNPTKSGPKLSPDGSRLSYIAPVDGVLNVFVGTPGVDDFAAVTSDRDRGVRMYWWTYDSKQLIYLQDSGGNENWNIFVVDIASKETVNLTPMPEVQARIIAYEKRHPDVMLVALNNRDPKLHDVYRIDLATRELTPVMENPGDISRWIVDRDLNVRGGNATRADGGEEVRFYDKGGWRTVFSWEPEDALISEVGGFTIDGRSLYLHDSAGANTCRLFKWNLDTDERTLLVEDPTYDVVDTVVHPDTGEVQAAIILRERKDWVILDPSIEDDIVLLREAYPGEVSIDTRDLEDRRWVVSYNVDDGPVSSYLYDRSTRELQFLFDNRPELRNYTLAKREPVSYTSRDGLTIHGYLTMPPGITGPVPTVLYVHGGPWGRDAWGLEVTAQWMANRGYAALQVNFRGSTGYGKAFVNAGDKEWGAKMHDDLVDAVGWAVDQGIADPKRVGIYGGSYGGYAALAGATFTPDLFCCSVDIVGPSNLITLINSVPPYWIPILAVFKKRIGDPETEAEFLKSRSPLFLADRIKIPMLIAQGANDPRVKQAESDQIVEALKANGVDHEYVLFEDEGHGFTKPENRLKFMRIAERFLAKHMGGRVEK